MQRRAFLAALAWLTLQSSSWAQKSRRHQLAETLLGQPLASLPEEVKPDLDLLLSRLAAVSEASLDLSLGDWPAGQQASRRILKRLLDPWDACPFANRPGQPPDQAAAWGLPCPK